MMVKVEDDDSALPPELMSPVVGNGDDDDYYYDDDGNEVDVEEEEEADSNGDGDGPDGVLARRGGEPPLKKGPWTPDEDKRLTDYVRAHGEGSWNQVRINAGLNRCGKSCRLRWSNHLRPDLKKGPFDDDEVDQILRMHITWGNKWAKMAALLPGRTDNEIKNFWNTRLKRHQRAGLPIYPEYLVSQASNQDMNFGIPDASHGTKRQSESSQNVLGINNLIQEYFDHDSFCKHAANVGDLPCPSLVGPNSLPMDAVNPSKLLKYSGCITSDYNSSLPFVQIPDESEKADYHTIFNYGNGTTDDQLAPLGDDIISGHPMFDGNHSTSWATQGPMKTELPSVQCYNYDLSNAGACDYPSGSIEQAGTLIDSPGSLKSESVSSQNTGLDAVVHNGDGTVNPIEPQGDSEVWPPPFSCNGISQSNMYKLVNPFSLIPGDDEIEGCPLGEIEASKSPSSSDVILAESYPDTSFTGQHHSSLADIRMHDASQEASFLDDRLLFSKDDPDSIYHSLIDGDYSEEAKLDLYPWESMPGAHNMPGF